MTMLTLAGALLSVALSQPSFGGPAIVDCADVVNSSACAVGMCPSGQACTALNDSCTCQPTGCCQPSACDSSAPAACARAAQIPAACSGDVVEADCHGDFFPGALCSDGGCATPSGTATATPTATATATATASATATNTRQPDGGLCDDPADCVSGNCVDDVCCDTACNLPQQACNLPGREGVCSSVVAAAPAASPTGLVLIGLALFLVGGAALWRARRGA
ncbi:MAG: hypothetical protein ABI629_15465 [bacterium]